jgi:hypothetical protein
MPYEVPPVIDNPKSFIGLGTRELFILGGALLLALFIFILPMSMFIKIFLAVLLVGIGAAAAFGRDPKTGKTLEQYLFSLFNFYSRARYQQRGATPVEPRVPVNVASGPAKQKAPEPVQAAPVEDFDGEPDDAAAGLRFRPLPLGGGLFMSIFAFAFLAALLFWVWGGGINELHMIAGTW